MMKILYQTPLSKNIDELSKLHVLCWQQAYEGIMPDDFLKNMSIKKRAEGWQKTLADNEVFKLIATVDNKVIGFVSSGSADEKSGEFGDGEVYAIYVLAEHYR